MSNYGWFVIENVVIYSLAAACFLLLPDWWRLCGLAILIFVNTRFGKRDESHASERTAAAEGKVSTDGEKGGSSEKR